MHEGSESGYTVVTEHPEEPAEEPRAVSDRAIWWERLILSLLRIRKIQRPFRSLLRRLTLSYPQGG